MTVVRGDRAAESQTLNRCSFEAHLAYSAFVATVPDDFGRFRADPVKIALRMFPRRTGELRRIEHRIARWLAEWEREGAVLFWELDGVRFAQVAKWKPTGNTWHRTPEPPGSEHVHGGRCLKTAIARAVDWAQYEEAEKLRAALRKVAVPNVDRSFSKTDQAFENSSARDSGELAPGVNKFHDGDSNDGRTKIFPSFPSFPSTDTPPLTPPSGGRRSTVDQLLHFAGQHGIYLDRPQERALKRKLRQGVSEAQIRQEIEAVAREKQGDH